MSFNVLQIWEVAKGNLGGRPARSGALYPPVSRPERSDSGVRVQRGKRPKVAQSKFRAPLLSIHKTRHINQFCFSFRPRIWLVKRYNPFWLTITWKEGNSGITGLFPFEIPKASVKRAMDSKSLETMFEGMGL